MNATSIEIVLCLRDGVWSLVEGPSVAVVAEWFDSTGPKAYERVTYRALPIRYPGQLTGAELWYGCKVQRPFRDLKVAVLDSVTGNE